MSVLDFISTKISPWMPSNHPAGVLAVGHRGLCQVLWEQRGSWLVFLFPVLAAKREDPRRMRRGQGRKRDCGWFGPLAWWMNRRQAGSRTESTSDISCIQALEGQSRREYSVSGLAPSITKI
jgi:hypothetical protein